ncbi:hypothetical protein B0A49_13020 [Cryomyces minteri]|uniref:MARVEL domain-containing protein n=1 Tax=Cryomyces minteri TaxID=331657 RepID=A0A4U0V3X2_9PEZI|nr:hypothetical protein B0A49_13020 [Cryomyces minteri]
MVAPSYYNPGAGGTPSALKPMLLADSVSINSSLSGAKYDQVLHDDSSDQLYGLQKRDERLKQRIRILKLTSRIIAAVMSAVTFVPMTMTLVKYLQTKDTYHSVGGASRTAWADNTSTWPTYMYFGVATASLLFNSAVVFAYLRGVQQANRANSVAGYFGMAAIAAHLVTWAVAAGLFRYAKQPHGGQFRDLWGWTCSAAADQIQQAFVEEIQFGVYCSLQSVSWYSGLVNAGTAILTGSIYFFSLLRLRSKRRIQRLTAVRMDSREALRA